jgi:mutator protein MutT
MKRGIDYIGVSVGAMILNDKGEVLLCKRSQNASNERGCWEIPGGAVEFNETLENAIHREIKEELSVDIELLEQFPAATHIIPSDKQHWVPTTFLAKLKAGNTPKIMEPEKCDEIRWFSLDHLPTPLSLITQYDLAYYKKRFHR